MCYNSPEGGDTPYFLVAKTGENIERIEENYQELQDELAKKLLKQIKENTPAFFEKLVIDLLVKMGYGGVACRVQKWSDRVVTVELTASLRKTRLDLISFMFKPNAGKMKINDSENF